ncbi:MAG: HEAT repeat domain-containing protein [Methanosarcinaceae archaeon]|nr:HEAT repeat domain-containing protein [Methanosarcinaceae archaeon]
MKKLSGGIIRQKAPQGNLNDLLEVAERYSHPDDEDINESLVRALESTDTSDRKVAVDELVALNDLYAASRIFWVILNGSKHARIAAAEVMGKLGGSLAVLSLTKALKDPDKDVRKSVVEAMRKLGVPYLSDTL